MLEITQYTCSRRDEWDAFVRNAKNATFLLERGYMDYHSDRFCDASIMIYKKGRLEALMPLNVTTDARASSHDGLTYGGLILNSKATAEKTQQIFALVNEWLKNRGVKKVTYKPIPWIYTMMPAEEDLYAIVNTCNARLSARQISSVVSAENRINFTESRKSGIRKAEAAGICIKQNADCYDDFWQLLETNLRNNHNAAPVHSLTEITRLAKLFPQNISLHMAYLENEPLAGTVIYQTPRVAHTQYISASQKGKSLGALDLLFRQLINKTYCHKPYFDFGTSTLNAGKTLNTSLIFQKEGFGARAVCYDTYEWTLQP